MKKLLISLLLGVSVVALCGCNQTNKAAEEALLSEIEALPTDVIPNESEETESELIPDEDDWTVAYQDEAGQIVTVNFVKDVPDDFALNDNGTFGDLANGCAKYMTGFDKEVLNRLFAAQYSNPDVYKAMVDSHGEEATIDVITNLVIISDFINHNKLTVNSVELDVVKSIYTYHTTDISGNEFHVIWSPVEKTLKAYAPSTGREQDAGIPLDDELVFLTYRVYVMDAFGTTGEKKTEADTEVIAPETGKSLDYFIGYMNGCKYLGGSAEEMLKAVVDYYDSDIESIEEDKSRTTKTNEAYLINMVNGKQCLYCGSDVLVNVMDMDSAKTSIIWEK